MYAVQHCYMIQYFLWLCCYSCNTGTFCCFK